MRVLISTHEFSPYQGSECAVGWNIAIHMANYHEVTVLCADGPPLYPNSYRNAYKKFISEHGKISNLNVVFVNQPRKAIRCALLNRRLMSLTKGIGWQGLYYLGLDHWHRKVLEKANTLGISFDVVHQLTPISFLRPGYLWTTPTPFFWGPVGGMYKVPMSFRRYGGTKSFLFETLRNINISYQSRNSTLREIVKKARHIWAISDAEFRRIKKIDPDAKVSLMIDTAPPAGISGHVRRYDGREPLKICWSGRHEPRKALPILLRGLAQLPGRHLVHLNILGGGPLTPRWKKMAERLGLNSILTWHGRLSYDKALQVMGESHVFVHTSFREAASMVVLEALGLGMPVICHDACAMGFAVNDSCGIKVPFVNPKRSIQGFREALEIILDHPRLVEQLSQGALQRAIELSWDSKSREMNEAYLRKGDTE